MADSSDSLYTPINKSVGQNLPSSGKVYCFVQFIRRTPTDSCLVIFFPLSKPDFGFAKKPGFFACCVFSVTLLQRIPGVVLHCIGAPQGIYHTIVDWRLFRLGACWHNNFLDSYFSKLYGFTVG